MRPLPPPNIRARTEIGADRRGTGGDEG